MMRKLNIILVILLSYSLMAFAPAPLPRPPKKGDKQPTVGQVSAADLEGVWEEVSRVYLSGNKLMTSKLTGYQVHIINGEWSRGREGKQVGVKYKVKLDMQDKPTKLDLIRTTGTVYQKGVVERQGDTLLFCYSLSGPHPTKLQVEKSGQYLVTLKRKK